MPEDDYVQIIEDLGPLGDARGTSRGRMVRAADDREYAVKGPPFTPEHPQGAANELVCARLLQLLGLPQQPFTILTWGDSPVFATERVTGPWFARASGGQIKAAVNTKVVYEIAVFDALAVNGDRTSENLFVRRSQHNGQPKLSLAVYDHNLALIAPGETAAGLAAKLDQPPGGFVQLQSLRDEITKAELLDQALGKVEALSDEVLRTVTSDIPASFLPGSREGELIAGFLSRRRDRLRPLFEADIEAGIFPVAGGSLT